MVFRKKKMSDCVVLSNSSIVHFLVSLAEDYATVDELIELLKPHMKRAQQEFVSASSGQSATKQEQFNIA